MTAAFGTRPKRRRNRVMDALGFEYPDYERLDKGAEGQKRKRVASALNKDDEDQPKKKKLESEAKTGVTVIEVFLMMHGMALYLFIKV